MGTILGESGGILGNKDSSQKKSKSLYDRISLPEKKPEGPGALDYVEGTARAVDRGIAKFPVGVMDIAATLGNSIPTGGMFGDAIGNGDITQDKLYQAARAYEKYIDEESWIQSNNVLPQKGEAIAEGLGQIGGQTVAALLSGGTSTVSNIAKPIAGLGIAGMGTTEGLRDAEMSGATPEQIQGAGVTGTLTGLTEFAPVGKLLSILDNVAPGAKGKVVNILATGGLEGLQEMTQQGGINLGAKLSYDQEREVSEGLRDAGEVGGAVGTIAATIATLLGAKGRTGKYPTPEDEADVAGDTEGVTETEDVSNLPGPARRTTERVVDTEIVQDLLPAQETVAAEDVEVVGQDLSTLVRQGTIQSGDVLSKIKERFQDSPRRKQYALEYAERKMREAGVTNLPRGEQIDLPAEADSFSTPVNISTEEAETQALQEMLKDDTLPAEDKALFESRLRELQGAEEPARRADIDRRKKVEQLVNSGDVDAIAELIYNDDLTGLLNARAWNEAQHVAELAGDTLASLDLGGVKYMNDTFGHDAGDKLFQAIGDTLSKSGIDVFRKGGDEFAATIPSGMDAQEILENLRQEFANKTVTATAPDGTEYNFTGWSLDYGTGQTFTEADGQLYERRADQEATGKRNPKRGEKPFGLVIEATQGEQVEDQVGKEKTVDEQDALADEDYNEGAYRARGQWADIAEELRNSKPGQAIAEETVTKPEATPQALQVEGEFTKVGPAWIAQTNTGETAGIVKEGDSYTVYVGTAAEIQNGTAAPIGDFASLPKAKKALKGGEEVQVPEKLEPEQLKGRLELLKQINEKKRKEKIDALMAEDVEADVAEEHVSFEEMQEEEIVEDAYGELYTQRGIDDIAKDMWTVLGDERGSLNPVEDKSIAEAKKRLGNDVKRLKRLARKAGKQLFLYPNTVRDKNDQPIKVFHGTVKNFDQFSTEALGNATGAPSARLGYFFSQKPATAEAYLQQEAGLEFMTWTDAVNKIKKAADHKNLSSQIYPDLRKIQQTRITSEKRIRSNLKGISRWQNDATLLPEVRDTLNDLRDRIDALISPVLHPEINEKLWKLWEDDIETFLLKNEDNVPEQIIANVKQLRLWGGRFKDAEKRYEQKFENRYTDPEMLEQFQKSALTLFKNMNMAIISELEGDFFANDSQLRALYEEKSQIMEQYGEVLEVINEGEENLSDAEALDFNVKRIKVKTAKENIDVKIAVRENELTNLLEDQLVEKVEQRIANMKTAGPNIRPSYLSMSRPLTYDMKGKEYREKSYYDIIKKAWSEGYDGVIIKNTFDGGPKDNIYVVKESDQIHAALEHDAEVVEGLWKKLSRMLSNQRGSVDLGYARGLASELMKKVSALYQGVKKVAVDFKKWGETRKRAEAKAPITDEQQEKDLGIIKHYMQSFSSAYKNNLDDGVKELWTQMRETRRIVDQYKKGSKELPIRQRAWIQEDAKPGTRPGVTNFEISKFGQAMRSPSFIFRNFFETWANPSVDMSEAGMAFLTNLSNNQKWAKDILSEIPDTSKEMQQELDKIYEGVRGLIKARDKDTLNIARWTEELRLTKDDNRKAELVKKIKDGRKRIRVKTGKINHEITEKYDSKIPDLAERFADVRITMQVLEELPIGVKISEEEVALADQIRDFFQRSKDDLKRVGVPVIEERQYIHKILPEVMKDSRWQGFAKDAKLPLAMKFMHQEEDSRVWYPSAHMILDSYIPMAERKIAFQPFLNRWTKAIDNMPEGLRDYMEQWVNKNLFREPLSNMDKIINNVVAFEYVRLIGGSLSVGFKHATKAADSLASFDIMTNTKAGAHATKAAAERLAQAAGIEVEGMHGDLLKAFVNSQVLVKMMDETPNITQTGKVIRQIAGAPVNAVETFDNGVTLFSTLLASMSRNMSHEQASRIIWETMLAANFRGGHDQPLIYKDPKVRAVTMFQMTPHKLWEFRGHVGAKAFNGERDVFGTRYGVKLARYIFMFGLAEQILQRLFNSSIVDQALHFPYFSHWVTADREGYSLHEPTAVSSPIVDWIYQAGDKGVVSASKEHFNYWGQLSKTVETFNGRFPRNYYTSPITHHLGIKKKGAGQQTSSRRRAY